MRKKVIIDTDLGDDIDDAFAVLFAEKSEELDVLGITTVYRCPEVRARMTKKLLCDAGIEADVYCGEKYPLVTRKIFNNDLIIDGLPCQYDDFYNDVEIGTDISAFEFFCRTLEKEDHVTIVTLGALTNAAKLVSERKDLLPKIDKIVVMGGAFGMKTVEYNIACDPEAVQVVIDCGLPVDFVGLDVTLKCEIEEELLENLWKKERFQTLYAMRKHWGRVILHDPLTVATLIDDSIVTFQNATVGVETKGEYTYGMMLTLDNWMYGKKSEESNVRVAVDVDVEKFKKLLFEKLGKIQ